MDWAANVDELLYEGETIERRRDLEAGAVVVTSHRVLAFTPGADGENYRAVDLPNVEAATVRTGGETRFLRRAITPGFVGVGLLAAGALVSVESYAPTAADAGVESGTPGAGTIAGTLETVRTLFAMLDALVLLVGLAATAVAVAFGGLYIRSRSRTLVLRVAGEDDLELPLEAATEGLAADLERTIRPDGESGDASDGAGGDADSTESGDDGDDGDESVSLDAGRPTDEASALE